ncbi:ImmA/IrrE family metallo-endopeptidase [Staphylococcus nepalensis]|uniref:ImmA/IrrE family metallo-endopeptidase n=1 Tax=Staphylococcus nepalensis TaxID=214473 RepID=UPI003514B6A8
MQLKYEQSFLRAAKKVQQLTNEKDIEKFPLPIKQVIKEDDGVFLLTYKQTAEINKCTINDVARFGKSNEAFHIQINGMNFIIYNDEMYYKRLRFTLAHEYGHLKLNHSGTSLNHTKTFRDTMRVKLEEYEANTFASCLLFPLNLRYKYRDYMSIPEIADLFQISESAASIAMKILDEHLHNGLEEVISVYEHEQFSTYISYLDELLQDKIEYLQSINEEYTNWFHEEYENYKQEEQDRMYKEVMDFNLIHFTGY